MQANPKYRIGYLCGHPSKQPGPATTIAAAAAVAVAATAPVAMAPASGHAAAQPASPVAPSLTYRALAILPQLVGLNEQLRRAEQAARQGDPERARQALSRLEALANEGWLHLMQQETQEQTDAVEPRA